MAFRRAPGDGQAKAVAGGALPGGSIKGLTQLGQMLGLDARAVVTHADFNPFTVATSGDLDRLPGRIEALGIAQQIIQGAFEHGRPALEAQRRLEVQVDRLLR